MEYSYVSLPGWIIRDRYCILILGTSGNKLEYGCDMQYSVFYTVSFIIWKRDEICLQFNTWGAAIFWLKSHSDEAKPSPLLLLQIRFYMQPPSSLTYLFYLSWPIILLYLTFTVPVKFSRVFKNIYEHANVVHKKLMGRIMFWGVILCSLADSSLHTGTCCLS
jgi:hypothetical protein